MGAPISASMGAMSPLLGKLNILLLRDAPQNCSSESVKNGIRLLKQDVEKISSYLDDLSEVEDPPPTAICWMNEARGLSYDMEDYIDSLLFVPPEDPSLVSNIKTSSLRKFFSHVKTPESIKLDEQIVERLSELRMHIQQAIDRHKRYGVHFCSTSRRRFVSLGPMLPTQYAEETANVVIDDRVNEFINSLANDGDQQLKVVSILGSACLGKTTLARVLYKNFGKRYNCRAFIQVSKKPDMKKIYHDMLLQLQRQQPPKFCEETDLIDRIKEYLRDKRYLIIIDDVWAASVWDIIDHVLPKGNHGSRIIATTQIEDVALTCCYQLEHVFEMKPLDNDHSRRLFFNRLFGSEHDCPEELKQVCNEVVETCGGLPLATISIASLLASQPVLSIDLLTYIDHSLSSLSTNSTSERTRQILNLSFNNLPHYLKTCLLYLSMYPEGYIFFKDDLVKQWMAEGFIDTIEGQDMYKVAESYLSQLIDRRFIQPIWINYNNEVVSCAVHDAVHDLIVHKSAEENFIVAINYSQKNVALSHRPRRLSLLFGDARCVPANITKSQVRSLNFFGLHKSMPCIGEFKLLRVLNLQLSGRPDNNNVADLTTISELFQLRYLKIACDVYIKLPNLRLECLETLDITDVKSVHTVPWDIHLPHLLHLSLPLEKILLDGIGRTMSLNLGSIGRLNYLQDLHLTPIFNLERNMEALGYLVGGHGNLRTVVVASCLSVENILGRTALKAFISWNDLAPPPLLQRFECSPHSCIVFYQIPKWIGKLGNLCILKIAVTELMKNCVDILRGLPALTALSLYMDRAPIEGVIFDKVGFSVLKYFKLKFMSGIAWIKFEEDAMPNLLRLRLIFNAVPNTDLQHIFVLTHTGKYKQYKRGNALIIIEHMPSLREIYTKFGGTSDLEYASMTFVSNHPSNPTINMQLVDHSSCNDESTKHEQQSDEIVEEEIYTEFGGTSDLEYASMTFVSNHPSNPTINMQLVDHSSCSDESTIYEQQSDEIVEEEPTRLNKQQPEEIMEKESPNYDKIFERLRISRSPEYSSPPHVPAMGCLPFLKGETKEEHRTTKSASMRSFRTTSMEREVRSGSDLLNISDMSAKSIQRTQHPSFTDRPSNLRLFTFSEIKKATRNFSRSLKVGEGGFGCVYRGIIKNSDDPTERIKIAVKQLNREGFQGQKEWLTELNVLGIVEHPNIIKLLGYCADDDEQGMQRLLVYEYMPNGSVYDHLASRSSSTLSWPMRLKVALDVARGLKYLHEEMDFQVIFRSLKPSNILLDENWNAKLSDFGHARHGPQEGLSHVSTVVVGTLGYVAPEYIQTGHLTAKSDIWSYGVLLYELITGRRPIDRNHPKGEQMLLDWVKPYISDIKQFPIIVDPRLEGHYNLNSMTKLAGVANRCLLRLPKSRPKMRKVYEKIQKIVDSVDSGPPQPPLHYHGLVSEPDAKRTKKGSLKRRFQEFKCGSCL